MKKFLPRLLNAALALAAPAVFAAAAHAGEVTLYTHDNFGGPAVTVRDQVPDLSSEGFNDRASSVRVRSGRWQLCENANFDGHCIVLGPGEYRKLEGFNDVLSSLREVGGDGDRGDRGDRGHGRRGENGGGGRGGAPIVLYSQSRFNGAELELRDDTRKLDRLDFNDQAGSVIIREGSWQLCDDADFRGKCVVLSPGRYDNLRDMGDRISSVRRVR
ncbi:Beta/Gamma crystallin [Duganella sp. CF517]|uniref:beta/gamma crystallin-related protein n=1 Tax=Duganella sp. CF517 TaxID=1881038 RepID=UPI0008C94986|nr:beta/gamma crystallin-related protein [Duganella sp. CF517]SEN51323.1 Beta/Gamma crystallin [Duganella sp. CF517]